MIPGLQTEKLWVLQDSEVSIYIQTLRAAVNKPVGGCAQKGTRQCCGSFGQRKQFAF